MLDRIETSCKYVQTIATIAPYQMSFVASRAFHYYSDAISCPGVKLHKARAILDYFLVVIAYLGRSPKD